MLIEHPISVIDDLLKLGIGDKGRLVYLKNAIKNGNKVYDSDKEFLKKMQNQLDKIKSVKSSRSFEGYENHQTFLTDDIKLSRLEEKFQRLKIKENNFADKIYQSSIDSGINKIKRLMGELKTNNSRLMDNLELLTSSDSNLMYKLELLRINREIASGVKTVESDSVNDFVSYNNEANLSGYAKNKPTFENSILSKIKKHDLMIFASAGLFTIWYADYQNLIDIGWLSNIAFGLAAGAAVSAVLFYKKYKHQR